jgi:prepilin-type N-terminal cleavage/methylation domain-containing protein
MIKRNRSRGFSLLEAVIALAVGGIVATGMLSFYLTSRNVTRSSVSQLVSKKEGYGLMEFLSMQLREANLVQIYNNGYTMNIQDPDGNLLIVDFDPGTDLNEWTTEDNAVLITRGDNQVLESMTVRRVSPSPTMPIFSRNGNQIIITMRVGDNFMESYEGSPSETGIGQQGLQIQTTVFLRNA